MIAGRQASLDGRGAQVGSGEGTAAPYAVVAGGGTAGHVLPALAVARALADRGHAPAQIQMMGSTRGQERNLLAETGFPVTLLPGRGISRRLSLHDLAANVAAAGGILWAVARATATMARRRPAVVVSVGGYASVPAGVAAVLTGVPLVLVNVDAVPGLAHRLLDRWASAAAVAFPGTPLRRAVVTGAPVRAEVAAVRRDPATRRAARAALGLPEDRTVVAVVGGSLGARRLNEAAAGLAQRWSARGDVALYHVVGRRDWADFATPADAPAGASADVPEATSGPEGTSGTEATRGPEATSGAEPGSGLWYRAVAFEDRMPLLYEAADLVLCRAGAMTASELAVAGVGAVLVPLPGAPGDHQTANARALVHAGAGLLLPDEECTPARLEAVVGELVADGDRLAVLAAAAHSLGRPDAAEAVAEVVERHAR